MEPTLQVTKSGLLDALRHLRIGGRPRGAELLIAFDGECLRLDVQGMQLNIPAAGRWPGTARIASRPLDALVRVPPAGEDVVLRFAAGRCYFGSFSVPGAWQDIGPEPIDVPLNADIQTILALKLHYNDTELTGSGLALRVNEAWKKVDQLIHKSVAPLEPFGITAEDIHLMLCEKLRKKGTS